MPGLDDSTDQNNYFFKVFKKYYSEYHLVIYLTSSDKAFMSQSEINLFEKVKKVVDEGNQGKNFTKLIVVVNKFEDKKNRDLNEIYNRIPDKINISKDDVFKISAHKLLIENIKNHKIKDFKVPKFIRPEFGNVLKNSRIMITPKLFNKFKTSDNLSYEDLEKEKNEELSLSLLEEEEGKTNIYIDDKDLIEFLKKFSETYYSHKFQNIYDQLKDIKIWMQNRKISIDCYNRKNFQEKANISYKLLKALDNINDKQINQIFELIFNISEKQNKDDSSYIREWRFSILESTSLPFYQKIHKKVLPYFHVNIRKDHWLLFIFKYCKHDMIDRWHNSLTYLFRLPKNWKNNSDVEFYSLKAKRVYGGYNNCSKIQDIEFKNNNINLLIELLDTPLDQLVYLKSYDYDIYKPFNKLSCSNFIIKNIKYCLESNKTDIDDKIKFLAFEPKKEELLEKFKDLKTTTFDFIDQTI